MEWGKSEGFICWNLTSYKKYSPTFSLPLPLVPSTGLGEFLGGGGFETVAFGGDMIHHSSSLMQSQLGQYP